MTHQWPVTQATWEFPAFLWWASRAVIQDSHLSASSSLRLLSREQWTIFKKVWEQVSGEWESYSHVWTEVQAKPSLDLLGTSLLIYLTIPSYREGGGSQWSSFECLSQTSFLTPVSGPRSPFVRGYLRQVYTHTGLCYALVIWVIPGGPKNPGALISNISGVLHLLRTSKPCSAIASWVFRTVSITNSQF